MNVVFLSPAFPPTASAFCSALARAGAKVLGVGADPLRPDLFEKCGLSDYLVEPRVEEYQALHDVVANYGERYGTIDRIESDGEHWLEAEARLRDDYDVPGIRSDVLRRQRSKLGMAAIFARAEIPHPPTVSASDATAVRRLAAKYGYPLVFKPDTGSGAVNTFLVRRPGELDATLEVEPQNLVAQPFVSDRIITFDGLTDAEGRIVFFTSHVYDTGIMQVRLGALDGSYYSLRELPPGLEALGRRAVEAFDVRARFFHLELFQLPDAGFVALEMNLRPPGGFTTEMMNAACDVDVYALWAAIQLRHDVSQLSYRRRYHVAHAGRRAGRRYRLDGAELRRRLGSRLIAEHAIPLVFAATMGDVMYMLRDSELDAVKAAIELVQSPP